MISYTTETITLTGKITGRILKMSTKYAKCHTCNKKVRQASLAKHIESKIHKLYEDMDNKCKVERED